MENNPRPRLIQQRGNTVTMLEGGIPILVLNNPIEPGLDLVAAVNFLRCGCPKVQLVIDAELAPDTWTDCKRLVGDFLDSMSLVGEKFTIEWGSLPKPYFITISRTLGVGPAGETQIAPLQKPYHLPEG
ncbi:MAG: hypothetical protein HY093_03660 [Candidatus Liptonbacteria bacterium]|nr:hypothetical protein [Candidatus Liptonbacteria bacterium]